MRLIREHTEAEGHPGRVFRYLTENGAERRHQIIREASGHDSFSKMYIFPGTEDMTEACHDDGYYAKAACVGTLIRLVVRVISWIAA